MFHRRFHLPVLLSSHSMVTTNLVGVCSILLMFISTSSAKFDDRALTLVKSIDEYLCKNYVFTCFFRQRHHHVEHPPSSDNNCKSLLILHSCLHYDADTIRMCSAATVTRAKHSLEQDTPKQCFTSSLYKSLASQHLRSIGISSTVCQYQTFVLFVVVVILFSSISHLSLR